MSEDPKYRPQGQEGTSGEAYGNYEPSGNTPQSFWGSTRPTLSAAEQEAMANYIKASKNANIKHFMSGLASEADMTLSRWYLAVPMARQYINKFGEVLATSDETAFRQVKRGGLSSLVFEDLNSALRIFRPAEWNKGAETAIYSSSLNFWNVTLPKLKEDVPYIDSRQQEYNKLLDKFEKFQNALSDRTKTPYDTLSYSGLMSGSKVNYTDEQKAALDLVLNRTMDVFPTGATREEIDDFMRRKLQLFDNILELLRKKFKGDLKKYPRLQRLLEKGEDKKGNPLYGGARKAGRNKTRRSKAGRKARKSRRNH